QGVNKTVTISGLTLNNNSTYDDYALPSQQQTTTAIMQPFMLTVAVITADGRSYNNNTAATITTSSGSASSIDSDSDWTTRKTSGAAGTFSDKHQGVNKTVTISGLTLNSNSCGDYQLPTPQQTTTATITPFTLTVSGITASDRAYNNTTGATINTSAASANYFRAAHDGTPVTTSAAVRTSSDKHQARHKTVRISGLPAKNNST